VSIVAKSQEDTEFWFAAPDITAIHGDYPIRLRITALDDPATVEIYLKSNLTTPVYTYTFTPQESKEWVLANADVENSPINTVNNKGIYIKSTAKVTAYYDLDHGYNMDIFALKGANALGTEFYTPFGLYNENDNRWTDANASIEIIATENGTAVTIEPSVDLTGHPKSKGKFTIYLNKGQTYSLEAKSQLAPGHPAGTKITSNKKIAVTVADDSMNGSNAGLGLGTCADLGGDQIIPTNILGTKYIVMRGKIYGNNPLQDGTFSGESAFVLSTIDGTEVKYIDDSGEKKITVNAGKTVAIPIKYNSLYIKSSSPVYVYHISGFQCEMGAAILPTIEGCTGSQEVTIVKTRGDYDFFVNLMVPRGSEDDFEIVYQNGTIKKIPADWFEPVIGSADTITKEPTWMVLKSDKKKLYNDFIANEPAKIRNSESFFHLGVIMGMASVGCKYGYFSSYNVTDDRAFILGDNADAQTDIARCYGEIIQFRAYGGVNRNGKPAYSWEPKTYLSNPYISNPWLINAPPGTYDYKVNITRPSCFNDTSRVLRVTIYPEVKADFVTDKNFACSPAAFVFTNNSIGGLHATKAYQWVFSYPNGKDTLVTETPSSFKKTFTRAYRNVSDSIETIKIKLTVQNAQGCTSVITREVKVYPEVTSDFSFTPNPAVGCNPVEVKFTNKTTGSAKLLTTSKLGWSFGDSTYSVEANPTHIFTNYGTVSKTYKTYLTVTTPQLCSYRDSASITVYPAIKASFTLDKAQGCDPLTVKFTNESTGAISSYQWSIDGVQKSTSKDFPSNTFDIPNNSLASDTFTVSLRIQNANNCVQTVSKKVVVNPIPQTAFTVDKILYTTNCTPPTVSFINSTPESSPTNWSYFWDFGDSTSSSLKTPTHIYQNFTLVPQTYIVKLSTASGSQCSKEVQQSVTINPTIEARINLPETHFCAEDTVVFTYGGLGIVNNITWTIDPADLMSQNISADKKTVKLVYRNNGTADATKSFKLKITNAQGCTDEVEKSIWIYPKTIAKFTRTKINESICKPTEVQFKNTSNAASVNFVWDFGDGSTSSLKDPTHIYENYGTTYKTYTVKLKSTTPNGCQSEAVDTINIHPIVKAVIGLDSVSACSDVKIVAENKSQGSYQNPTWEFQDKTGVTVSTDNKTATLNYSNLTTLPYSRWVRLIVRNTGSCIDTATKVVTINPKAVAQFNYTAVNSNICKPQEIQFANQSNAVSTSLTWDFGDGATSSIASPNHIYENYGAASKTYTVKLIASTIYGCKAEVTKTVDIHPIVKAVVGLDTIAACSGIKIVAENSSFGAFQNPVWKFQDVGSVNVSNDNKTATLNYLNTTADPYTRWVRLIISNSGNCVDSVTKIITVYPKATAKFDHTLPDAKSCKSLDVQFINQSSAISTSLLWEFGDGAVATSTNPVHSFENFDNAAKTFVTKLISSTLYNCKDTFSAPITLHPIIKAQVDIVNAEACSDNEIVVKNTAQGAVTSFEWKLEESYRSSLSTDQKTLTLDYLNTTDAAYTRWVRLIAHNSGGCSDSVTRLVTIHPRPRVTFTPNHSAGCQPLNVAFLNSTNQAVAVNYEWDFGDGGTSNEQHPQHRFEKLTPIDTTFIVSLRAISAKGCDASITRPITLYAQIVAKFDIQQNEACSGQNFTIVNSSEGQITNYDWELTGDGVTDSHSSASQFDWVFVNRTPKPISRTISLVTQNSHCQSTTSRSIIIYPNPVSAFTASTTKGCQPLTVQFANTQASEGALYLWNFGDTATSSLYNPVHTFRNLSLKDTTYNVTLHAQYAERCQADSTFPITVYAKVKAVLNLDDVDVCSAKSITVSNGSLGPVKAYNWFYDWRNNKNVESTTSQSSYSYTYTNTSDSTRTFRMALVAKSDYCADTAFKDVKIFPIPKVNFEPSTYSGCQPLTVNFNNLTDKNGTVFFWDFGDKANSSERNPVHIFNSLDADSKDYTVHFWATSADGCIDSTFKQIKVEVSPITKFWVDPSSQHYPNTSFTLINATNPGNWEYLWNFDDNTTSTLKDPPLHTFSLIGDYNIKLTASNKNCSSTYTVKTTIKPPLSSTLIDTSIISCPPISVSFKNLLRGTDLKWDFNDGTTTSEANPVHVFDRPGTYHIQLSSNLFGTQQFQYQTVIIYPLPTAGFNVQPEKVMLPEDVMQCENTSELCNNNIWYFGDGSVSEERFPKHRYTELGKKDISLVVWSENGCKDSINKIAAVEVIQSGDIMFPNAFIPNKSGPTGGAYTLGDMKPTSFFPYHRGIEKYKLQIYNRWGELLFETDDINIGWDGYYKGKLCKQDVYVYKAKGKFVNGKNFMRTGDVTLFHP
jgi:gliding motility-associated-like protein